jgi:glycosyltransferase involved in cell wall biosynthesis
MTCGENARVSVVIPTYNRANYLPEAIDSVLSQDFDGYEIVVVDDGSTDSTSEVLSRYAGRIRVVRQANAGCAPARTRCIHEARAELVAFLDSDDRMLPGRLKAQYAFMRDHPDVAVLAGNLIIEGLEQRDYFEACGVDFAGKEWAVFERPFEKLLEKNFLTDSGAMIRRSRFMEIGGYDTSLRRSADWDLWLRMGRRFSVACLEHRCTWVRRHGENLSISPLEVASNLRVVEKALECGEPIRAEVLRGVLDRQYAYLRRFLADSLIREFDPDWRAKLKRFSRRLSWARRTKLRFAASLPSLTRRVVKRHRSRKGQMSSAGP